MKEENEHDRNFLNGSENKYQIEDVSVDGRQTGRVEEGLIADVMLLKNKQKDINTPDQNFVDYDNLVNDSQRSMIELSKNYESKDKIIQSDVEEYIQKISR